MSELTCSGCVHAVVIEDNPVEHEPIEGKEFIHQRCYHPQFPPSPASFTVGNHRLYVNNHYRMVSKTEIFRGKTGKIQPSKSVVVLDEKACELYEAPAAA
jgi:hypothetical protein